MTAEGNAGRNPALSIALEGALGGSAASAAQRLYFGLHILQAAMKNASCSRCEWALRTWFVASSRTAKEDAELLIRDTEEINGELANQNRRFAWESLLSCLVMSIRAALNRQAHFALMKMHVLVETRSQRSSNVDSAVGAMSGAGPGVGGVDTDNGDHTAVVVEPSTGSDKKDFITQTGAYSFLILFGFLLG